MKQEKRRIILQMILQKLNILTLKEGYKEYYLTFDKLLTLLKEYEKYVKNEKKL